MLKSAFEGSEDMIVDVEKRTQARAARSMESLGFLALSSKKELR